MSRFVSIEPVGILKACTTKVRMKSARMTATTMDSRYSRTVDFWKATVVTVTPPTLEHGQEGLLRDVHGAHPLHPLLAFLLLLEELALAEMSPP